MRIKAINRAEEQGEFPERHAPWAYEILAPLGAGGMGEVYRAKDTRLGRDVALKVMPPEAASDSERLRRFEQEARAAAALNHPNILVLHDLGTHEGAPYIVTELLEGQTLRQRLQEGPMAPAVALDSACRSPRAWRRPTARASSTGTSSPRTSGSPRKAG